MRLVASFGAIALTLVLAAQSQHTFAAEIQSVDAIIRQLNARCGTYDPETSNDPPPGKVKAQQVGLDATNAPCWMMQDALDYLDDKASEADVDELYAKAVQNRIQRLAILLWLGGGDYSTAETRMSLADNYADLRQWSNEETLIRAAIIDYRGAAGEKIWIDRARTRLAINLNNQKRFADAEAQLQEIGLNALLEVEGIGAEALGAHADALEGLSRWADAEPIRRKLSDSEALIRNLQAQGKSSAAADVALDQRSRAQAADAARAAEPPLSPEAVAMMGEYFENLAIEYEKKGQHALARSVRLAGKQQMDQAFNSEAVPNLSIQPAQSRTAGYGRNGFIYPGYASPEGFEIPSLLFAAGRYKEADNELSAFCQSTLNNSVIDNQISPAEARTLEQMNQKLEQLTPARCFGLLALAKWHQSAGSNTPFSSAEFIAAQYATQSSASAALNKSGARKYAQANGLQSDLEKIDGHTKALARIYAPLMEKYPWPKVISAIESENPEYAEFMSGYVEEGLKYQAPIEAETRALEDAISELYVRAPEYFELRSPKAVSLEALRELPPSGGRLLHDDEALIIWMLPPGQDHGLVYAITQRGVARVRMKLSVSEINARVHHLRSQIDPCAYVPNPSGCSTAGRSFDRQASFELYDTLLGSPEIQAVISPQEIKTLLIIPSGSLTALPPAVLITEQPEGGLDGDQDNRRLRSENWLIKRKALAILPGVSALTTLRGGTSTPVATNGLYMLADPDFSGTGSDILPCQGANRAAPSSITSYFSAPSGARAALASLRRLPCTRGEGQALLGILGGDLYLDSAASEARLRRSEDRAKLAQANVVAFATHGLVTGDLGLGEPALALAAPSAGETDDGFLTTSEVLAMKLNADWVVLSACNTASPDSDLADGLSGLSRAFFQAGAKSLLVSHWRVDDLATQGLTTRTLELREGGLSKAEALRKASLELMSGALVSMDGNEAFPGAWAPFTVIGEPR